MTVVAFVSLGEYLGMTVPILTIVRKKENHSVMSNDVTVAYYLPANHQAQPPQPHDSEITIELWPATIVYARYVENKITPESLSQHLMISKWKYRWQSHTLPLSSARPFTGPTNEVTIMNQINAMAELLDSPGVCVGDSFIVAGYTNPAHPNRQNEIWFLERP